MARQLGKVRELLDSEFTPIDNERWDSKRFSTQLIYDRHVAAGQQDLQLGASR